MSENIEKGMISVVCEEAYKLYHRKSVRFTIEDRGETKTVFGKFLVKLNPTRMNIEVPLGKDFAGYHSELLHLPQSAVDSIRPTEDPDIPFEVMGPIPQYPHH
jgi:hypothetical protein